MKILVKNFNIPLRLFHVRKDEITNELKMLFFEDKSLTDEINTKTIRYVTSSNINFYFVYSIFYGQVNDRRSVDL